jgi:hypothetical protein
MNYFIFDKTLANKMQEGDELFNDTIQKRLDKGMGCYSSIPLGWKQLVEELVTKLENTDPDYCINQIKEKFGGLRFYVSNVSSDEGLNAIESAEDMSFSICEVCGNEGVILKSGWKRVLCDNHNKVG